MTQTVLALVLVAVTAVLYLAAWRSSLRYPPAAGWVAESGWAVGESESGDASGVAVDSLLSSPRPTRLHSTFVAPIPRREWWAEPDDSVWWSGQPIEGGLTERRHRVAAVAPLGEVAPWPEPGSVTIRVGAA